MEKFKNKIYNHETKIIITEQNIDDFIDYVIKRSNDIRLQLNEVDDELVNLINAHSLYCGRFVKISSETILILNR